MDKETYLKEMLKHVRRNTSKHNENNNHQKKIQITMHKKSKIESFDRDSLELYRQMMVDRCRSLHDEDDE
jgi:hypothetical protein